MPEIVALLFFLQGGFRDPAVVLLLHPGLPFQEGQLLFQPVVLFQQLQRLGHEVPALDADQHNKDQDAGLDEKGFLYIQPEQIVVCYFQQGGKGQDRHGQKEPVCHPVPEMYAFPQGSPGKGAETGGRQDVEQVHAPRQGYNAEKLQSCRPADAEYHKGTQCLKQWPVVWAQHHQGKEQERDGQGEHPQKGQQVQEGRVIYEQSCQVAFPKGPCAGTQGKQPQPEKSRPRAAEAEEDQGDQGHDHPQHQKEHGKKQREPHFREQPCRDLGRTPQQDGMERGYVPLGGGKVFQCERYFRAGLRQGHQRRLCGRVQQECREVPVLPVFEYQMSVRVKPHGCVDGLDIQVIPRLRTDPGSQRQRGAGGKAGKGPGQPDAFPVHAPVRNSLHAVTRVHFRTEQEHCGQQQCDERQKEQRQGRHDSPP